MVQKVATNPNASVDQARTETVPASSGEPLAYSVRAACHQLGDIGKTSFYKQIKKHSIKLVKFGARSAITRDDLHRLLVANQVAL